MPMRWQTSLPRRVSACLNALLPQDCPLCAAACGTSLLCDGCRQDLPRLKDACPRCAMPTLGTAVCGQCLKQPPHFDTTLAALRYAFPADQLVLGLKFGARLPLAVLFAELLAEAMGHGD